MDKRKETKRLRMRGMTFTEIGKKFGVSRQRASQYFYGNSRKKNVRKFKLINS